MRQISAQIRPRVSDTAYPVAGAVRWIERAVEFGATRIAYGLKLPAEQLAAVMRRGLVHGINEYRMGEDDSRFRGRLVFRAMNRGRLRNRIFKHAKTPQAVESTLLRLGTKPLPLRRSDTNLSH